MSEKIEINTLITKHENKCKDCRFDMIDVEDPLWEYGSPLKRVLIDNQTGETYDSVSELVGLLNNLDNDGVLNNYDHYDENKQLKKECKIAIDEMVTDYKKLEKENEQLKKDVKELEEEKRMTALQVTKKLNDQQDTIDKLEQKDYYNQSERYKILCRAIELASDYIHTNNLEYYDFCGLVTECEEELLEGKEE